MTATGDLFNRLARHNWKSSNYYLAVTAWDDMDIRRDDVHEGVISDNKIIRDDLLRCGYIENRDFSTAVSAYFEPYNFIRRDIPKIVITSRGLAESVLNAREDFLDATAPDENSCSPALADAIARLSSRAWKKNKKRHTYLATGPVFSARDVDRLVVECHAAESLMTGAGLICGEHFCYQTLEELGARAAERGIRTLSVLPVHEWLGDRIRKAAPR